MQAESGLIAMQHAYDNSIDLSEPSWLKQQWKETKGNTFGILLNKFGRTIYDFWQRFIQHTTKWLYVTYTIN